jgi:choline-glycine betaine transporter
MKKWIISIILLAVFIMATFAAWISTFTGVNVLIQITLWLVVYEHAIVLIYYENSVLNLLEKICRC